ncbi:hypothetical protein EDD86DRAFT_211920, partial [Gorgonomyces haynaldii]
MNFKPQDSGFVTPSGYNNAPQTYTSAQGVMSTAQAQVPMSAHRPEGNVTIDASEFISFSINRLWNHQPGVKRRNTTPASKSRPHVFQKPPCNPVFASVVSPPGTESWYPSFVEAIHKLVSVSGCPLPHIMIALLYVARLRKTVPVEANLQGTELKVFTCALILAQKTHSDERYSNRAWSNMSGFSLQDINTMEREFLQQLNGKLFVKEQEYSKWVQAIQILGQEHALVLKAAQMSQHEFQSLPLNTRPDLVEEIQDLRKSLMEDRLRRAKTR